MQTIDEVKRHCRVVGEGIVAAVAAGEDLGKRFEGAQSITFRVEKNGSEVAVVGGEIAPDDSGIYTTEKGVFKFYGDELVGYAFERKPAEPCASSSTRRTGADKIGQTEIVIP